MPIAGCFGGKGKVGGGGGAARPRYVPRRGKVFRAVLGALISCYRPARTGPLPR
ncbi:hypothetical protein CFC21_084406 [Triticum aestivum]|uniref:Uncharacterized protein n=3 Tax=Triticum TaxID=4564 RepID=A0A3B6NTK0_WHEAT|nr:hypothetical protein TRIUR3_27426 [Triticum urartu]KAF7080306.1 hypothetical protein CFC21_084406 [Triticum aestivum]